MEVCVTVLETKHFGGKGFICCPNSLAELHILPLAIFYSENCDGTIKSPSKPFKSTESFEVY